MKHPSHLGYIYWVLLVHSQDALNTVDTRLLWIQAAILDSRGTHAQRPVIDVHSKKMPKKFKGENTKASVAKEKKAAARNEADEKKRREEEDAYWKDDDKQVARKQERMVNICI